MAKLVRAHAAERSENPWSVDRWGRLLAGCSVLAFAILALLHHPVWASGALAVAGNLVVTSLTNRCALHDLLVRLGAREREDLYYPGGGLRGEATGELPASQDGVDPTTKRHSEAIVSVP